MSLPAVPTLARLGGSGTRPPACTAAANEANPALELHRMLARAAQCAEAKEVSCRWRIAQSSVAGLPKGRNSVHAPRSANSSRASLRPKLCGRPCGGGAGRAASLLSGLPRTAGFAAKSCVVQHQLLEPSPLATLVGAPVCQSSEHHVVEPSEGAASSAGAVVALRYRAILMLSQSPTV